MKKLDLNLVLLLGQQCGTVPRDLELPANLHSPDGRIRIAVSFRGDIGQLKAAGFVPRSVLPNRQTGETIATGTISVDKLEALARLDNVISIESPQEIRPALNYSGQEINARVVQQRNPGGFTGAGVVVGIIDTGFEPRHKSFYDESTLLTRIIEMWDQSPSASGGAPGPTDDDGNSVGRVYDSAAINEALQARKQLGATEDEHGHGTRVAGIAAGDGSPACCCVAGNTYVGIAPAANIIAVALGNWSGFAGDNQLTVDAINHIFTHPKLAGKPLVVNISLGDNMGAHDGTSLVERAIDSAISTRANSAVVVAAGNSRDKQLHTEGSVPPAGAEPGTFDVAFTIADNDTKGRDLDLWYPSGASLGLTLAMPGGVSLTSDSSNPTGIISADGAAHVFTVGFGGYTIIVQSQTAVPHSLDNRILIQFYPGGRPSGDWILTLINSGSAAIDFHAWLQAPSFGEKTSVPVFKNPTEDSTITVPGTSKSAISVAAYQNRKNCCSCTPSEDIADFSGLGPVRKNATNNPKPNITAPGLQITAASANASNLRGDCCDCCPDWCCCVYESDDGTSFAAPHVTGTIALMLEANPSLQRDDIAAILQSSAIPTAAPDPNTWGAGKLDADAAVQKAATWASSGTGGSGTGGSGTGGSGTGSSGTSGSGTSSSGTSSSGTSGSGTSGSSGAGGGAGSSTTPPSPSVLADAVRLPRTELESAMRVLSARIRAVPNGERYAALVSRHFSEVRRLINNRPRVATMWHRGLGPKMLKRVLRGAVDETSEPPISDEQQREYMARFFGQLARFGSENLKRTLENNGESLLQLLQAPLAAQVRAGEELRA